MRTDEELMVLYRRGSRDAFEELFARHHRKVVHFCYRMTGDQASAEEAAQELGDVRLVAHDRDRRALVREDVRQTRKARCRPAPARVAGTRREHRELPAIQLLEQDVCRHTLGSRGRPSGCEPDRRSTH